MTEKEAKAFYNSGKWKKKRIDILKRDHYECQDCVQRLKDASVKEFMLHGDDRKIRSAKEVHHIRELKEYPDLGLDEDNLISLCTQ